MYYLGLFVVAVLRYPALLQWRNGWMLLEIGMFDYRGDLPVSIMGALWSVSTEVQFYLLVPVLMVGLFWLRDRVGRGFYALPLVLLCAGTLLRLVILHFTGEKFGTYGYAPMLPNLDIFLCGMTLSMMPRWKPASAWVVCRRGTLLLLGAPLFYVLMSAVTSQREHLHIGALEGLWAKAPALCVLFAGAFIVLAESGGKFKVSRGAGGLFLLFVEGMGAMTYCLYVFHSEIFLSIAAMSPGTHSLGFDLRHLAPVLLATVGLSYLFYRFIEKPFERRKKIGSPGLLDAP